MTAIPQDRQSPEEIERQVNQTNERLAESVEAVAYRAGHFNDELKAAAKDRIDDAKNEVIDTVSQRAQQAKSFVLEKKQELTDTWKARSTPRE